MQDASNPHFDPYVEWLGTQPGGRPPDHYALLGLKRLEGDTQVIARAAEVRLAAVRRIRPGPHLAEWSRLLDRLKAAKICLLDPASKAAYDASLEELEASGPAEPAPGPRGTPADVPGAGPGSPMAGSTAPDALHSPRIDAAREETPREGSHGQAPAPPSAQGPPAGSPGSSGEASRLGIEGMPWVSAPAGPASEFVPGSATQAPVDAPPARPSPTQPLPPAEGGEADPAPSTVRAKPGSPLALAAVLVLVVGLLGLTGFWVLRLRGRGSADAVADRPRSSAEVPSPGQKVPASPVHGRGQVAAEGPPPTSPAVDQGPGQPPPMPEESPAPPPSREPAGSRPPPSDDRRPDDSPPPEAPAPGDAAPGGTELGLRDQGRSGPPPAETNGPREEGGQTADQAGDPAKQAAFREAISRARLAMAERDLVAARAHLRSAGPTAQSPAEQAELGRLETMLGHLDEFWKALAESVSQLEAASELVLKQTRVAVVDSSRSQLTVKAAGRIRRWPIEDLPTAIVVAVAEQSFPEDAASQLRFGAFLAVDPEGDRDYARGLWEQAAAGGLDVKPLMPELDVAAEAAGGAPKTPVPTDPAQLQRAARTVRENFRGQYAQATGKAKRLELANALLAHRPAADLSPEVYFVMLREARDLAIAAGEPGLACRAVDRMAEFFTLDALQAKTAALEGVAEKARGWRSNREIVEEALRLLGQALDAKRADEARRLAALAVASARNSRSTTLLRRAASAAEQLRSLPTEDGGRR